MQKGDINALKDLVNNGNITKEQFKAVENIYQKDTATANLTPLQKTLYNQSGGVLQKLLEKSPDLAADIKVVTETKKAEKNIPNMNTSGFEFAPSATTGGGTSFKTKSVTFKIKKPKKVTVSKVSLKAPKKPKAFKVKKLKAARFSKIKPLKKVKRF